MKENVNKEIDLLYHQEEYFITGVLGSFLGAIIVIFSLFILIFAPGKTTAKYGTIADITDKAREQIWHNENLLVLLDDGSIVEVSRPDWFKLTENRTVILQETSSMFLGIKRYSLYKKEID